MTKRYAITTLRRCGAVLTVVALPVAASAQPDATTHPTSTLSIEGTNRAEPVVGRAPWGWPTGHDILRRFEAPMHRYGPGHRGLDLAATPGSPIRAVADGVVTHAGLVAGRGTVSVRHDTGLTSTYEPLDPACSVGDHVRRGEIIGSLTTGPHCGVRGCLHLGARRGQVYLDPLGLLRVGRIRLVPWAREPVIGKLG